MSTRKRSAIIEKESRKRCKDDAEPAPIQDKSKSCLEAQQSRTDPFFKSDKEIEYELSNTPTTSRAIWKIKEGIAKLKALPTATKKDDSAEIVNTDIAVGWNISLNSFRNLEKTSECHWLFLDGTVYIYEYKNAVHGATANTFITLIAQNPASAYLDGRLDSACYCNNPVWEQQPDSSYAPRGLPRNGPNPCNSIGQPWPTFVLEVAVSQQLWSLRRKLARWLGPHTGVQLGIGIKVYAKKKNGIPMLALLFNRANPNAPTVAISFGTRALHTFTVDTVAGYDGVAVTGVGIAANPACNAPGMALYQLPLPLASVFHGLAAIPGGLAGNLTLDLYEIQQAIVRNM